MTTLPAQLASLVAAIDIGLHLPISRRASVLRDVMASPLDVSAVAHFARWQTGKYTRNLLQTGALWQLLLLCWEPGARSPIHDHAGGECFLRIVTGTLCATPYALRNSRHEKEAGAPIDVEAAGPEIRLRAGDVDYRNPEQAIHQVRNPLSDRARAMSLHLYCNRADTCLVYDPIARTAIQTPVNLAPELDP